MAKRTIEECEDLHNNKHCAQCLFTMHHNVRCTSKRHPSDWFCDFHKEFTKELNSRTLDHKCTIANNGVFTCNNDSMKNSALCSFHVNVTRERTFYDIPPMRETFINKFDEDLRNELKSISELDALLDIVECQLDRRQRKLEPGPIFTINYTPDYIN